MTFLLALVRGNRFVCYSRRASLYRPFQDDIKLISAVGIDGSDEQPFIDAMANHLKRNVEKVALDYSASKALDLISEAELV